MPNSAMVLRSCDRNPGRIGSSGARAGRFQSLSSVCSKLGNSRHFLSTDDVVEAEKGKSAAMVDIHVPLCSIVAFDPTSICTFTNVPSVRDNTEWKWSEGNWSNYRVCGSCEQVLPPENSSHGHYNHPCERCRWRPRNPSSPATKHLYKLLMSIVTDKCATVVVVFDRAARNLFGCPADDFLRFLAQNASAVEMASKVLEGEMLSLVLRPPKGGYGQHLRAVSIVPLSSSFQPIMAILPQLYASGRF